MGDERGNHIQEARVTPLAIAIGSQMLHATGLAWSEKYKSTGNIACTFFGDGATSEGDFHEAANFAANLDLPVVFVCQNNGWAISTPSIIECSAPTVAQRGLAYGMDSIQVDEKELKNIGNGNLLDVRNFPNDSECLVTHKDKVVAMYKKFNDSYYKPVKVLI